MNAREARRAARDLAASLLYDATTDSYVAARIIREHGEDNREKITDQLYGIAARLNPDRE